MRDHLACPLSTQRDHHGAPRGALYPPDKSVHLKKTDVAEEVLARATYAALEALGKASEAARGGGGESRADKAFRVSRAKYPYFDDFPEPSDASKAGITAYGTHARFWDTVLGKKVY